MNVSFSRVGGSAGVRVGVTKTDEKSGLGWVRVEVRVGLGQGQGLGQGWSRLDHRWVGFGLGQG